MKRISMLLLILFLTVPLFAQTKIIFDADIDTDCDDGGALAVLHALADKGEVEILATMVSTRYPYAAPCVEAINRYYGRPNIPIGAPKTKWAKTGSRGSAYAEHISKEYVTTLNNNDDAPDAVRVYRQILANQESNSVVILTIGYLTNIRDLLESKPDDISPLSGVELIIQKVSRWVLTGGTYPSDYNTAVCGNYTPDPTSAHIALRDWPEALVPVYISGKGVDIQTGSTLPGTPTTNPNRRIYELRVGLGKTRASWDQIGLLYAVRPNHPRWTFRTNGYHYIFKNGTYEWRTTPDKNHTMIEYNTGLNAELRQTIDELMIKPPSFPNQEIEKLRVAPNNRVLMKESGVPFFSVADTAWKIAWKLNRDEVEKYLQTRKEQKFNTIGIVAFPMDIDDNRAITNVYGHKPLEYKNGKFNPLKPVTTSGGNYKNSKEYDYWDHLEYIIDTAESKDMYIILLPAWGGRVAGAYGSGKPNAEIIFDKTKAYKYALWISKKFKDKKNIIWMIGGDRSAVYGKNDYRSVFRAMAKGITDSYGKSPVLISYHPQKWAPNSSKWFHDDKWLSFNSVQDQPSDQIKAIEYDYNLTPAKPTWLFEGRYEKYGRGKEKYTDWQIRFQSYQTVFAGGFGVTYGNMDIWHFSKKTPKLIAENNTSPTGIPSWEKSLNDPGARQMRHLLKLMTLWSNEQYLERIPDQSLIDGDKGKIEGRGGYISSVIQATRGNKGDYAMIYSASGRNIRVNMNRLAAQKMSAYWFNPRNGKWWVKDKESIEMKSFMKNIPSGKKAPIKEFDPPGGPSNGNDWVLVLDLVDARIAAKTILKSKSNN